MLGKFIWGGKKPRIKAKKINRPRGTGSPRDQEVLWSNLVGCFGVLMAERSKKVLGVWTTGGFYSLIRLGNVRCSVVSTKHRIRTSIMAVWAHLQDRLAPSQSTLVSFFTHPGFRAAMESSSFMIWHQNGITRMWDLCQPTGWVSWRRLCRKLGGRECGDAIYPGKKFSEEEFECHYTLELWLSLNNPSF